MSEQERQEFEAWYWRFIDEHGGRPTPFEAWQARAALAQQAVPEIDYKKLIADCYRITKQAQGTRGCVCFKLGAEWFREQVLAAAPAAPQASQGSAPEPTYHLSAAEHKAMCRALLSSAAIIGEPAAPQAEQQAVLSDEQIDALMPLPKCTYADHSYPAYTKRNVREAVRAALAAQQAEREPLTDEDVERLADICTPKTETGTLKYREFARAIERAHGICKEDA